MLSEGGWRGDDSKGVVVAADEVRLRFLAVDDSPQKGISSAFHDSTEKGISSAVDDSPTEGYTHSAVFAGEDRV